VHNYERKLVLSYNWYNTIIATAAITMLSISYLLTLPLLLSRLPSLVLPAVPVSNSATTKKRSSSSKKKPAAKPKNQRKLRAKTAAAYTTLSKKWNYCWTVSLNTCQ
jgi:hypothetical protein